MSASLITRRALATVVASVAVVGAAALPAAAAAGGNDHDRGHSTGKHSTVMIGKVQYDSPGRDDRSNRSLNGEWVEVKNTGKKPVNLRGYTLADRQGHTYRFHNLTLAGHSSVKVHTGKGNNTAHDVYQNRTDYVWDKRDAATLRNDHKRILDSQSWGKKGR
ncbi:lamin tail domain-containing protein [Streptomyces sp. NPDC051555]|uniref:lamin tail domain-containing protein n=1 Tax=Streptomyces sp. NPDC051555 TaxID=3365657 RepID=UPI0037AA4B3A